MKPNDYIFNIGDEVITTDGQRGRITCICHCEKCKDRGFYEPSWEDEYGDTHYISNYEAENNFRGYYKIGAYRFNPFEMDSVCRRIVHYKAMVDNLEKQLKVIVDELEAREE